MAAVVPLVEARALTRHYDLSRGFFREKGVVRALDGVSFTVGEGETLAVVGESGCGKSTLARQVTMIERPTGGSLCIDGDDVATADRKTLERLRPRVQMCSRIRSHRSIRARRSARSSKSHSRSIRT